MNVRILAEDSYAKGFFNNLVPNLKNDAYINQSFNISVQRFVGICNPKSTNQVIAASDKFLKIIILVDCDYKPSRNIKNRILQHIPSYLKKIVTIIMIRSEIEEWICISLGLRFQGKPSDRLKESRNYHKYDLPKYANEVDVEKLLSNCASFKEVINELN
jgi:hypothetical protein